ncbi:MAG TPA: hypothetical protein PK280_08010 [Planctomycetota bacterium]|nr:hypothetical protein [Planctomycetota bacterium]
MVRHKVEHCLLGLVVATLAVFAASCLQPAPAKIALWGIALIAFFWAIFIGHAPLVIPALLAIPFGILRYLLVSPVKLVGDRAFEGEQEILAYCVLPDRIVLVREFPTLNEVEGHSLFLPRRVSRATEAQLSRSVAIRLSIDEESAARVYGQPLPALSEFNRDTMDRSMIDGIHSVVGKLWSQHKASHMRGNVLSLAAWYALAADKYFRRADCSWVHHAIV